MQAQLKINRRGDLMVTERPASTTATSVNKENTPSILFISFFFTVNFFQIFTAPSQVRFIWTDSEQQKPAKRCRETKKGFTVPQTAVLTRPGSELLQSCLELAGC